MLSAKDARTKSEERLSDISALHASWFIKRAEIAIEGAIDRGRCWAAFDADDLLVDGWLLGKAQLEELGYTVTDDVGHIHVKW